MFQSRPFEIKELRKAGPTLVAPRYYSLKIGLFKASQIDRLVAQMEGKLDMAKFPNQSVLTPDPEKRARARGWS